MSNFTRLSDTMYTVKNQNGLNAALYDFFEEDLHQRSKSDIRKWLQNYPEKYPSTFVIKDQSFEWGRVYLEILDEDITSKMEFSKPCIPKQERNFEYLSTIYSPNNVYEFIKEDDKIKLLLNDKLFNGYYSETNKYYVDGILFNGFSTEDVRKDFQICGKNCIEFNDTHIIDKYNRTDVETFYIYKNENIEIYINNDMFLFKDGVKYAGEWNDKYFKDGKLNTGYSVANFMINYDKLRFFENGNIINRVMSHEEIKLLPYYKEIVKQIEDVYGQYSKHYKHFEKYNGEDLYFRDGYLIYENKSHNIFETIQFEGKYYHLGLLANGKFGNILHEARCILVGETQLFKDGLIVNENE